MFIKRNIIKLKSLLNLIFVTYDIKKKEMFWNAWTFSVWGRSVKNIPVRLPAVDDGRGGLEVRLGLGHPVPRLHQPQGQEAVRQGGQITTQGTVRQGGQITTQGTVRLPIFLFISGSGNRIFNFPVSRIIFSQLRLLSNGSGSCSKGPKTCGSLRFSSPATFSLFNSPQLNTLILL